MKRFFTLSRAYRSLQEAERKLDYSVVHSGFQRVFNLNVMLAIGFFRVATVVFPMVTVWLAVLYVTGFLASLAWKGPLKRKYPELCGKLGLKAWGRGAVERDLASSKWLHGFSLLWSAGVPISECLDVSAQASGNGHYAAALRKAASLTRNGSSLSAALGGTTQLPSRLIDVIKTAELGGDVERLLAQHSDYLQEEAKQSAAQWFGMMAILLMILSASYVVAKFGAALGAPLVGDSALRRNCARRHVRNLVRFAGSEERLMRSWKWSRRQFIAGATLAAATGAKVGFGSPDSGISGLALGKSDSSHKDALVVIFLRGAADGLNIAPPYGEDEYYKLRPTLAMAAPSDRKQAASDRALDLNGFFGLHPSLGCAPTDLSRRGDGADSRHRLRRSYAFALRGDGSNGARHRIRLCGIERLAGASFDGERRKQSVAATRRFAFGNRSGFFARLLQRRHVEQPFGIHAGS